MDLEQWFNSIPPVTRTWLVASAATSLLVHCQAVAPVQLYFSWTSAVVNGQPWRFLTTFCYFGRLSMDLAFHLYFMVRYSRLLEENSFSNRRADYVWLLVLVMAFLLAVSPLTSLTTMPFLASSLAFALVYIWSRRNPSVKLSFLGAVTISAPYLPFCLVVFSWILSGELKGALGDILGILAGHTYIVLQDFWPREMWSSGEGVIVTPGILKRALGQRERRDE
ncbi:hypothetical protein CspeluHIS016_0701780 [Cutaneotrichosporon spelunceum]|uniref:Derlin n=1 Tax=Cutaneotrichosporon spelunceum TaxID=1672016 RepID=A0AAD3TYL3_9TREE|nr:hypothetical protein CspeluHIS016_0701780 [Cutaneotrichosporon spelunceum]